MLIRYYRREDRRQVRHICAETGFLGDPIDPLFEDRELFADFLTAPYTDAEPENCLVLEGEEGRLLGYIMGSRSAWKHRGYLAFRGAGWFVRALLGYFFRYGEASRKYLRWIITRGRQETPSTPSRGVHFHINLLPEVRGLMIGKKLFDTFLDRMGELGEKSVFGQVISKEERRTERMFARYGFQLTDSREVTKFKAQRKEVVHLLTLVQVRDRTPPPRPPRLLLSLHDCHPGSIRQVEEQLQFCLSRCPGQASILVVPEYHHGVRLEDSIETLACLNRWKQAGHDLAIHGFYHDRQGLPDNSWWWTKFYSKNEAEFFDLSHGAAVARLQEAQTIWQRQGWRASGFVAPGWLYSTSLERELAKMSFTYTCTLRDLIFLPSGKKERAWAGTYSLRSGWRRALARGWHPLWKKVWGGSSVVRLSLHPRDLEVPFVRKQLAVFLDELAARGYRSWSYADHVQS